MADHDLEDRVKRFMHALEELDQVHEQAIADAFRLLFPDAFAIAEAEAFVAALFKALDDIPPEKDSYTPEQRASAQRRWHARLDVLAEQFPDDPIDWASVLVRALESAGDVE